jgi:chloramphenicol 3-O-phosphotransferase
MTASRVLIISGPIASGKSTAARALAADSRASDSTAAVVELDRMYMMLDDSPLMSDLQISRRARHAAAALVDQYVLDGIDLIIVEGDFWIASQRDEFTSRVSSGVAPVFVTLHVSVEEALRRVEFDASRRLSRIPEVLRRSHADFAAAPPIARDVTIDSTHLSASEVAASISSVLDGSDPTRPLVVARCSETSTACRFRCQTWRPDLRSISMRWAIS